MKIRSLSGALALLLLAGPVAGMVCGDCLTGTCARPAGSETMPAVEAAPDAAPAEGHCHQAATASAEANETEAMPHHGKHHAETDTSSRMPCHDSDSSGAADACCAAAELPESETPATASSSQSLEIGPATAATAAPEPVAPRRPAPPPSPPPAGAAAPLYTLNASLLI